MDPANPDITNSDVVVSTAGRVQGEWFCVIDEDQKDTDPGKRKGPSTG